VIPTPMRPSFPVVLDPDEAVNLTHLLDLVEDWLSRADDDARNGPLAAAGLIATVEQTALALHRRLKQANR
jgi:hypothetical protein